MFATPKRANSGQLTSAAAPGTTAQGNPQSVYSLSAFETVVDLSHRWEKPLGNSASWRAAGSTDFEVPGGQLGSDVICGRRRRICPNLSGNGCLARIGG